MLVWIAARTSVRDGENRLKIHADTLYSDSVRRQLAACQAQGHSDAADAATWEQRLSNLDKRVLSLAVVRSSFLHDSLRLLTSQERELMDYWAHSRWSDHPTVFVDVLECMPLSVPSLLFAKSGIHGARGWFSELTAATLERIVSDVGPAHGVDDLAATANAWRTRHGLPDGPLTQVVVLLPAPHAILVSQGIWQSWAFPFAETQLRAARFSLVKPLWNHFRDKLAAQPGDGDGEEDACQECFDSETLKSLFLGPGRHQ